MQKCGLCDTIKRRSSASFFKEALPLFYVLLTAFAAAIAIADQLTKVLAQQYLTGTTITLLPGWLQLHYITNDGMALSLFRGGRWMFVVLTAVYLALVIYAVAKKLIHKRFELWCLAAITGGAIGNLIDRVQTGLVIDMICIPWFSTFNVADIFITFGAIFLVLYILIRDKEFLEDKPKKSKEQGNDAETGK
ncbi:MAG TPA: signal peptidase II [Clostridiales bacterium]|nr:signal peptidase II [Clostridiales bacterium]